MIDKSVREKVRQIADDTDSKIILFESPAFDKSIVGIATSGQAVYDFDKMVKEYAFDNGCTELEAIEFIEYNTLRALPYVHGNAPIVFSPEGRERL